jgi:glucosamine-6-phosphate deaminase
LVLGLATGSTPLGLYEQLVRIYQTNGVDFSQVTTFNLDEYCGLGPDHPQSYRYFMDNHLFNLVNIDRSRVHFPDENDPDQYEPDIKAAGGVDLQILGIGRNGHIGFNEPGSSFGSRTRVVDLTKGTKADNARFFKQAKEVPLKAVTMGLGTIMEAKEIVLLASGSKKSDVMEKLLAQRATLELPASILHKHNKAQIIIDKDADRRVS